VTAIEPGLTDAARAWRDQDPDTVTREELDLLIVAAERGDELAARDLASRFSGRLAFGTAGLRGELGAGPMRMNRVLVAQAAAGLAAYLLDRDVAPSIVIGYDGRHNSEVFARDTATIMAGAGVRAILLPRMLPTPVLAFAVRHFGTSAGVMVTASHNPPRDNGYKVYLGGENLGAQIVAPADAQIAAEIDRVATGSVAELPRTTDFTIADDDVVDAYVLATSAIAATGAERRRLRVVYSAMHGVGWEVAERVLAVAGADLRPVSEQLHPDPDFPTVAFPNPEEPGAMDLTFAHAAGVGADLALVNDPDADRLGVAIPTRDGSWRAMLGNEIGLLLGWRAALRLVAAGRTEAVLACSLVSSPALASIAAATGVRHEETLTGFKWISRVDGIGFGFEEALGFLVDPAKVRDKDGISAALDFLIMASELAAEGRTVEDRLDELAELVGGTASGQVSIRVTDLAEIGRMSARLREHPPTEIAGRAVVSTDDFLTGVGTFAIGDILRYRLDDGSRVIVRPSGTEPKLKVYLDALVEGPGTGAALRARAASAITELEAGVRALLGV
jgi:phosphomannomutase